MAQYYLQIQVDNGWLAKNFEVTVETPIPSFVPEGRVAVIMTNTTSYNEISQVYDDYDGAAIFSYDEAAGTVSCSGAHTQTWDID